MEGILQNLVELVDKVKTSDWSPYLRREKLVSEWRILSAETGAKATPLNAARRRLLRFSSNATSLTSFRKRGMTS